ncbi:uncharacterized protein LOC120286448 [Eucalyptus grandis]|uniref:uncharacterized protein LOC120286448 n=1 Tax=Eucalyptus grandis TaxID=71139 RepID=UPI00192EA123|nr:uncharacterized protein LOC120286448 [Eucalyptus grandis]
MSIDVAIAIAWDVFKSVVAPIKRQFGYVIYSKRHAQDLQEKVVELADEVDRVHNLAEEARNNLRKVYGRVTEWHASAEKALKEVRDLLRDFQEASKTCCYETLPDPKYRYQFSRKAKDKIEVIQQLTQECREFKELNDISSSNPAPGNVAALTPAKIEGISSSNPSPGNVAALTPAKREGKDVVHSATVTASASFTSTSNKVRDDGVFESRASIILDIMGALADDSNSVVGVYGQGGVGKSTLLADVKGRMIEKKSFDWVAKADVSENPDIKKIQGEIAHALGLDIKNEEIVSVRAELLHKRLENEERKKKVLIILDNLWKGLDLKSVGIPCGHDNKVIGCKLLLTSRFQDVLRREMGCDRDFHLKELRDEEAKRLFESMVGDKVHDDPFKSLVDEAIHKCAGLPFLIISMAIIFKDAEFYEWKDVLTQIEKSTDIGISESINKTLQLSYDRFKGKDGEEVKSLLRLCVVYGVSKPSLENLVRYSAGLRLFREDSSMEEIRNRLNTLIQKLKAASLLLEDNEDVDGFKIHDLVRGFIASVASRDNPLLVLKENDNSVIELPKDKLRSCTAVCFPYVDMKELPEELDCAEMRIFLLFMNNESLKVPNSYFNSMKKLMVLHLSHVCLTCSPSPFQLLENLHTLCLDGCLLEDVAMIGKLKGLHILSFVNSKIQRLPKEIGQLVELRLLDLSHCPLLKIIEPGVLGNLMKLEELYMENSFDRWNAMEQTPTNAMLIELNNMKNLYTLHVSILDPSALPEDLNVKKLTKYKIHIGDVACWQRHKGSSILDLKLDPTNDILQKRYIRTLLGKTDNLFLDGLNGIEQSICVLSQEAFPNIKHLHVQSSPSIHYVLQSPSHADFKMLESLILMNLINLEKICNNHISSNSFSALKLVEVRSCNKIEVLFPLSLLRELPRLEEIQVINCHLMREIVEVDDCGKVELCNLHVLILYNLPNIKKFFTPGTAALSSASKDQVGTQVAFFNGQQVAFPSLETLEIGCMDNFEIIWDNQVAADSFHKLKSLEVWSCNKLLNIVPSCILGWLKSLESLEVGSCDLLEVVFKLHPLDPLDGHPIVDLPLRRLVLNRLPELKCIWDNEQHSQVKFQYLRFVTVFRCKSLTSLFPASVVVHLTQLEELEIDECGIVELIKKEDRGVPRFVFPKLTSLKLQYLTELRCIYIGKYVSHWPALKTLEMCGCDKVEILASHPENDMPFDKQPLFLVEKVAFPNLETLEIRDMDNIEIIWDNQVAADSFHKLKSLEVWSCSKLLNIVPSCILGQLKNLESLEVRSCDLLEVVFKLQPLNPLDGHPISDLPLKRLELDGLPKLKCVWDKELHGQVKFRCLRFVTVSRCKSLTSLFLASIVVHLIPLEELEVRSCDFLEVVFKLQPLNPLDGHSVADLLLKRLKLDGLPKLKCVWDKELHSQVKFQCLRFVTVSGCKSLTCLFPASVVIHLTQLEELEISECGIVELIKKEGPIPKVVFPRLTSLKLENLIELKCIYTRIHALCWPTLKNLEVQGCNKVEILVSQPENEMPLHKQPLFLIEKGAFPNLQELKLDLSGGMEIWHEYFHDGEFFSKLRVLELHHFSKEFAISTCCFVQSLANLEKLVVRESYQEELRINIEAIASPSHEPEVILPFSFQHLKTLEMSNCNGLSPYIILPFSGFFQHLKTLDMSFCDGLSNIFTLTIARNLVELTKLRIINCKMLTEVICDEEGEEGLVVAFNQLKYIELDGLTRLRCFSSIKYTLMFPLLEDVIVSGCPRIKFFSRGPIEAPKLERVQVSTRTTKAWFWKENLNITIQNMFEEMVCIDYQILCNSPTE